MSPLGKMRDENIERDPEVEEGLVGDSGRMTRLVLWKMDVRYGQLGWRRLGLT